MTASLARFSAVAAIVLGGLCALGVLPVRALAGTIDPTRAVVAWSVAFGTVLLAGVLAYLPMGSAFARRSLETRAQAFLVGLGIRLFLVLGVCVGVWASGALPTPPFLAGTGIAYLAILVLEITFFVRSAGVASPPATGEGSGGTVTSAPVKGT